MTGRLIGIGGHLGAGKDALADHLVAQHGFAKIGFSDPLHHAMMTLNPIIDLQPEYPTPGMLKRYSEIVDRVGYVAAKRHPEVRRLLQVFGTEIGRSLLGENVWTDIARNRSRELRESGRDVVITGIRFPNEVSMLREERGLAVWVTRPGHLGADHASERSVSVEDFDVRVRNDGSLEDLYEKSLTLLK